MDEHIFSDDTLPSLKRSHPLSYSDLLARRPSCGLHSSNGAENENRLHSIGNQEDSFDRLYKT